MSSSMAPRKLKLIAGPYVGQLAILAAVTLLATFVGVTKDQWGPLLAMPIGFIALAIPIYIGTRYRVAFDDSGISRQASGLREHHIAYADITRIEIERATAAEMFSMSVPFRRVAIYGKPGAAADKINVSLRHFAAADIEALLEAVRQHRPDLTIPAIRQVSSD